MRAPKDMTISELVCSIGFVDTDLAREKYRTELDARWSALVSCVEALELRKVPLFQVDAHTGEKWSRASPPEPAKEEGWTTLGELKPGDVCVSNGQRGLILRKTIPVNSTPPRVRVCWFGGLAEDLLPETPVHRVLVVRDADSLRRMIVDEVGNMVGISPNRADDIARVVIAGLRGLT